MQKRYAGKKNEGAGKKDSLATGEMGAIAHKRNPKGLSYNLSVQLAELAEKRSAVKNKSAD